MDNIGKASIKALVGPPGNLVGINQEPTKYNFDVSAWNWGTIQKSFFLPLLTERIFDEEERLSLIHI